MDKVVKLNVPEVEVRRLGVIACEDVDVAASGPAAVLPMLREILQGREQESFICLMLDARNRVMAWREVARGSSDMVIVPVRDLFRTALLCGAIRCVVAHNHPSGDPTPSKQDIEMTKKLTEAGAMIQCEVVDHVIVGGGDSYYSFAAGGALGAVSYPTGPRAAPELD
jgi:DNA repair protein RadC